MTILEILSNKEKLKYDLLQVTFFVILYENFKSNWNDIILSFYANSSYNDNGKVAFRFTKINTANPNAWAEGDFIPDYAAEKEYKNEVFETVKKKNGNGNDREASMFNWLLSRNIITDEYYKDLIFFRNLRNNLVHDLDEMLYSNFPNDLEKHIKKLIEIRKFSSREWFLQVEYPTCGEYEYDSNGDIKVPDNVYSNVDLYFDILYDALFK